MIEGGVAVVIRFKKIYALFIAAAVVAASFAVGTIARLAVYAGSEKEYELPIVMYHQLTKKPQRAGRYVLTLEQFEKDLIYLRNAGCKSITLAELLDFYDGKGTLPDKPVMITFDDGNETLLEYALPLLEKYGFTAIGFVIGSSTDTYTKQDDHNLNYSNLNWPEVRQLCEGGVIDIQSHTYDLHKNTSSRSGAAKKKSESEEEYAEFLSADAAKMKEEMLKNAGKEPCAVAYPFGSFSKCTARIMKDCGMRAAFTCEERVNAIKKSEPEKLFGLGRYNRPNGISSESFFKKMGIVS